MKEVTLPFPDPAAHPEVCSAPQLPPAHTKAHVASCNLILFAKVIWSQTTALTWFTMVCQATAFVAVGVPDGAAGPAATPRPGQSSVRGPPSSTKVGAGHCCKTIFTCSSLEPSMSSGEWQQTAMLMSLPRKKPEFIFRAIHFWLP